MSIVLVAPESAAQFLLLPIDDLGFILLLILLSYQTRKRSGQASVVRLRQHKHNLLELLHWFELFKSMNLIHK